MNRDFSNAKTVDSTIRTAELASGLRLPFVEHGDPSGVPMILLHGVTDSWRSFEPVLPHLPDSIHAFALTQRGHGDADRPAAGYLARDFATDVAAFADAVGLGAAIIVGHSMGSTNALRFAVDYPGRTLGLVLAGAFATYLDKADLRQFQQTDVAQLADPVDEAFAREFQLSTLARPVPQALLDTAVRESLKLPARVWQALFAGFFEDDFSPRLGEIRAPTLIVWGDGDAYCPRRDQQLLMDTIEGAQLVVYEGAGHAVHWEEPERFAADLADFAGRFEGQGALSVRRARR